MKSYQNVLLDLDGTLIDPREGITNAVKHALAFFGFLIPETEELYKFIGPPLRTSFRKYYNLSNQDTETAVEKYREFYRSKGIRQNKLFPTTTLLLEKLKEMNKTIILATAKPELFAKQILGDLNLIKYFNFISGATFDGSRDQKSDVIKHALTSTNIDPENSIMIGDREHDIIGANQNNMDSIGVLYGYGSHEELQSAGATFIIKEQMDILDIIKK